MKPITSITIDAVRNMIKSNMMQVIKEKWPIRQGIDGKRIILQQDNARPHCKVDDKVLVGAMTEHNWKIKLGFQPPNFPDINVLDLGYFNSIQALQQKKVA
mmetsp:Transcript_5448/g.7926  ORF Transcript_5448/g.7926 Transcript_5448/m.7926 type:complete len:101 (-) Transcript_5448:660-962(-)